VLGAIALIAGAIALVADIVLLCSHEGDWLDVIFGALGVMTFGMGRAVGAGLKITIRGAKAMEESATASRAADLARAEHATANITEGLSDAKSLAAPTEVPFKESGALVPEGSSGELATEVWSRAGVREMAGSLKPSAILGDLTETFAKTGTIGRASVPRNSTDVLGAIIGDADSAESLANLNKAATNLRGHAGFEAAYASTKNALLAVSGGIALDNGVLGASTEYALNSPTEPGAALRLDH